MTDDRLLDALFATIATEGWRGVTLGRLAAASGEAASSLAARFPSRLGLLRLHGAHVAELVAAGTVPDPAATPRDRLFDVLMRGLDALQPHRAGMQRLTQEMWRDPVLAVALGEVLRRTMARFLEAADISASGPAGAARVAGLTLVWLRAVNAWSKDESEDLGTTMAELDRVLGRADQAARSFGLAGGAQPAQGNDAPD